MKVVALAGGVGGAKLADGLARIKAVDLTVVVNTGDDFEYLGLKICPDLDTVCYTLAELANPTTGWGRKDETWHALGELTKLGGPGWFALGDLDIGMHLERTRRLRAGQSLSEITDTFCQVWGISSLVLPMSDENTPTFVLTNEGELPFQEYFVHQECIPEVKGFRFEGANSAAPSPGVIPAIRDAELVVLCPSNPWVSIDPILSIKAIRSTLQDKCVIAVSPIIGGKALKGPASKMFAELGYAPTALAVADHYDELLDGFVIDQVDAIYESKIKSLGMEVLTTHTIMKSREDRETLASEILSFGTRVMSDKI